MPKSETGILTDPRYLSRHGAGETSRHSAGETRRNRPGSRRQAAGFTLIEIIAVIVIIATLTGLVLLTISDSGRDRELQREAGRLAMVLRMASEDAVLRGQELGLHIDTDGYEFLLLEPGEWVSVAGEYRTLRPHRLPQGFEMDVRVEGLEVDLGEEDGLQPHIILLSSGELTPFEIRITEQTEGIQTVIEGAAGGEIRIRQDGEP